MAETVRSADGWWEARETSDERVSGASPSGKRAAPRLAARPPHTPWSARVAVLALWTFTAAAAAQALTFQSESESAAGAALVARVAHDLASRNVTECAEHLCRVDGRQPRLERDWFEFGCHCDDVCGVYGDCCRDTAAVAVPREDISCVPLRNYVGVYQVTRCPAAWPRDDTRRRCEETDGDAAEAVADPLAALPVTVPRSGLTYRNAACAQCHGDTQDAQLWQARVECPSVAKSAAAAALRRGADGRWGVTLPGNGGEVLHACTVDPFMPDTLTGVVRQCEPLVSSCPDGWPDAEVAHLCGAYRSRVYDVNISDFTAREEEHTFANPHCALCHGVLAADLLCSDELTSRILRSQDFNPHAFSIVLDVGDSSGSDAVGVVEVCPDGQRWDPFFLKCRALLCDAGLRLEGDECVPQDVSRNTPIVFPNSGGIHFPSDGGDADGDGDDGGETGEEEGVADFQRCPKFYLSPGEFQLSGDGTVYVELYDRRYGAGEFALRDGELAVCSVASDFRKFDDALSIISLVFLAASIFCLCCHLVLFCLVADLRNLSGKNLASLCVCLLVGYVCFMAAPFQESGGAGCRAVAIIMYTAFIGSFFWMNVMAFDVFTTLRRATRELRVSSGGHRSRYLLYALYVGTMTAILVTAAVTTDDSGDDANPYRPGFGDRVCWFNRRRALMVFFAAPLIVVMAANVALFVGSTRIIRSTARSTASMSCGPTRTNVRLYSRLATITGLSWVVGLVAGWLDFPPLWYAFVVLNTLQGVFIFIAFTLADRMRSRIRREVSRYSRWQAGGTKLDSGGGGGGGGGPGSDGGGGFTDSSGLPLTDCGP